MYLKDLRTQEYRSKDCDILLGKDIKFIATDNEQHKDFIISFLRKHGFHDQVKVVLFDDLQPHRRFASVAEDVPSSTASLQGYKSKLV